MKQDCTIPALELIESDSSIDLAAVFAHKLWVDHPAWNGANQRARERVYSRAFTVLTGLVYRKLIAPDRPYHLTNKGRSLLLELRETKNMLRVPLYSGIDDIASWYDGPIIFLRYLRDRNTNTALFFILMNREIDLESFLVSSLSADQARAMLFGEIDMRTAIEQAERHYTHLSTFAKRETKVQVYPFDGNLNDWLPAAGEFYQGNEENN